MAKMACLTVDSFLSAFSKILTKRTCVVFFLAESKQKHKDTFYGGFLTVFLPKTKKALFGGVKIVVLKLKFRIFLFVS